MDSSPLKELPVEIRGIIYGFVFEGVVREYDEIQIETVSTPPILYHYRQSQPSVALLSAWKMPEMSQLNNSAAVPPPRLGISTTCRAMRAESLYFLFLNATLCVELDGLGGEQHEKRGCLALLKTWLDQTPYSHYIRGLELRGDLDRSDIMDAETWRILTDQVDILKAALPRLDRPIRHALSNDGGFDAIEHVRRHVCPETECFGASSSILYVPLEGKEDAIQAVKANYTRVLGMWNEGLEIGDHASSETPCGALECPFEVPFHVFEAGIREIRDSFLASINSVSEAQEGVESQDGSDESTAASQQR